MGSQIVRHSWATELNLFLSYNSLEAQTPILWQHIWQRADSFEMTLMLEKIEGRRRRGQQRMRWLVGITDLMELNESE